MSRRNNNFEAVPSKYSIHKKARIKGLLGIHHAAFFNCEKQGIRKIMYLTFYM